MRKLLVIGLCIATLFAFGARLNAEGHGHYDVSFVGAFNNENIEDSAYTFTNRAFGSVLQLHGSVEDVAGHDFEFWVVNGVVRKDLAVDHEFIVTGPMSIVAVFTQAGQHAVLFMDSNGELIDTQYVPTGSSATHPEGDMPDKPNYSPREGEARWCGPITNITTSMVRILQYEMVGEHPVTITFYDDSVMNELVYPFNSIVTLTTIPPEDPDLIFSHWLRDGEIVSYDAVYRFTAIAPSEVDAVYRVGSPLDAQPRIALIEVPMRESMRSYLAQFYIPEGYELVAYGMHDNMLPYNISTELTTNRHGFKYVGATNEFLFTFDNDHVAVQAYLVVKDELHQLHHITSNIIQHTDTIAEIQQFDHRVDLFGIVTKIINDTRFTVEDNTGAIFINDSTQAYINDLSVGDLVQIDAWSVIAFGNQELYSIVDIEIIDDNYALPPTLNLGDYDLGSSATSQLLSGHRVDGTGFTITSITIDGDSITLTIENEDEDIMCILYDGTLPNSAAAKTHLETFAVGDEIIITNMVFRMSVADQTLIYTDVSELTRVMPDNDDPPENGEPADYGEIVVMPSFDAAVGWECSSFEEFVICWSFQNDYTISIFNGTLELDSIHFKHSDDGGHLNGDDGSVNFGMTDEENPLMFEKPFITVVIEFEVIGSSTDASMIVRAAYYDEDLDDTLGVGELTTFALDGVVGHETLVVQIHDPDLISEYVSVGISMTNPGMTLIIHSITIYEKD